MTSAQDEQPTNNNQPDRAPVASVITLGGYAMTRAVIILLFVVLVVTGTLMMTVYSPATATAWGSVWYMQRKVPGGAFIRGLHIVASNALIVALVLQVLYWVFARLYRRSGIVAWTLGLLLAPVGLGASLTGVLLPWDQHGYWGTQVRTNILARAPFIGDALRTLLIGGTELGQLAITRFYTLHVIVLPLFLFVMIRLQRRFLCRRQKSETGVSEGGSAESGWSTVRDAAVSAVVFALLAWIVWRANQNGVMWLDAPASPGASDYPARPEWHTLFLYQWLKYFTGPVMEMIGATLTPLVLLVLFVIFPAIDRSKRRVAFPQAATVLILCAIALLTGAAIRDDANPPAQMVQKIADKKRAGAELSTVEENVLRARDFNQQLTLAQNIAIRSFTLADRQGIPPEGPLSLLMNDPATRGPILFAEHCAACHRFDGRDGLGRIPLEEPDSSDLARFGSEKWIRGLLADPSADRYFGRMKKPDGEPAHTKMSDFVEETVQGVADDAERERVMQDFDAVAAYLADEGLRPGFLADRQTEPPVKETLDDHEALLLRGRRYFMNVCNECHRYGGEHAGTFKAPEMRGYGSVDWIESFIADPSNDSFYRSRGREPAQMPSFKDTLSPHDRRMVAEWLHQSRIEAPNPPPAAASLTNQ